MKNTLKILKISMLVGVIGIAPGLNTVKVNATSSCQEIAKRYEAKIKGNEEDTKVAESGDTCGFVVLKLASVDEKGNILEGSQHFYVVKKDGTEIKEQQLLYQDKDKKHFPKIDNIIVKESGDFYATGYKEYPTGPTSFKVGQGYVARIEKTTGNVIWQNESAYNKEMQRFNYSNTLDIIEGKPLVLVGDSVKTTGQDYDETRVSIPQITIIDGNDIVNKKEISGYENYEVFGVVKQADQSYSLKLRNKDKPSETKEISINDKLEETKKETKPNTDQSQDKPVTKEEDKKETKAEEQSTTKADDKKETKSQSGLSLPIIVGSALGLVALAGVLYYGMKKKNKK